MWLYEEKQFDEVPEKAVGFVYLITNEKTGKKYIGKKLFTKAKTKQVKGKKKRFRVESDWKDYFGSNKELIGDVEELGQENFRRDILHICYSKGQCSYYEAKLQFQYGVLEKPDEFYNTWIMCRIHRKHLKL